MSSACLGIWKRRPPAPGRSIDRNVIPRRLRYSQVGTMPGSRFRRSLMASSQLPGAGAAPVGPQPDRDDACPVSGGGSSPLKEIPGAKAARSLRSRTGTMPASVSGGGSRPLRRSRARKPHRSRRSQTGTMPGPAFPAESHGQRENCGSRIGRAAGLGRCLPPFPAKLHRTRGSSPARNEAAVRGCSGITSIAAIEKAS